MSRDDLHFRLRIPEGLKARVEAAAKSNRRSMTAEIVAALEDRYPAPYSDEEQVLLAAAAAYAFAPGRTDGEFEATYHQVISYMRHELGVHNPQDAAARIANDPLFDTVTMRRLSEWMNERLYPWVEKNRHLFAPQDRYPDDQ